MTQNKWMGSCTQCWRQITYWIEHQTIYPLLAFFFLYCLCTICLPQLLLLLPFSLLIPPPSLFLSLSPLCLIFKVFEQVLVLNQCTLHSVWVWRGPLNNLLRVQEQKSNSHQVRWLESTNFHDLDTWPISCSANGLSSFRLNQSAKNVGSNAPGGKSHAASPARDLTV